MKRNYDSKLREKEFEVGAWVYVRLQPYRQVSVALRRNAKLAPRYYMVHFKSCITCIGQVAYKLDLP